MKKRVSDVPGLAALPVGSIIADFGRNDCLLDSPVIACKAAFGDWQVMGSPRQWSSREVVAGAAGVPLVVLHNPEAPDAR